ncbi:MAG TPA: M23 family metallopeptidase [Pyrinomonadaceae bacterium]|nr:M23 family metallopeptidase [Pyrinomonadaceae bacterium]
MSPLLLIACLNAVPSENKSVSIPPVIADSFAYPVSEKEYVTEARDKKDEWYNALDLGEQNHLGEDWNKNSGGNTDCGEPVYSIANGMITYAADAGPGWGNVIIITHTLPDGTRVQSLYGHLKEMIRTEGEVRFREKIGTIGNANGRYLCHLHFEIREEHCPSWDAVFVGYSPIRYGWVDPSDFIDQQRQIDDR